MSRKPPKSAVTPKQARYISLLLAGISKESAARMAGISPRRAREWHHQQAFQEYLAAQVDSLCQEVLAQVASLLPEAVRAFADALRTGEPVQRANTAARLIDVLLRLRADFNLARRIEALEQQIGGVEREP